MIEAMIAMLLTSILAIGMIGIWGLVSEQVMQLTIRQKALFVLHGEMERVTALYRHTDFIGYVNTHTDASGANTPAPEDRWIYRGVGGAVPDLMLVTSSSVFDRIDEIYYEANGGGSTGNNYVWLDYENGVVAKIWWNLTNDNVAAGSCYVSDCYELIFSLEYPYRFVSGSVTAPAATMTALSGGVEKLTAQTFIGRRE